MLEFYGRKFTCDECPICEGIEHCLCQIDIKTKNGGRMVIV